MKILNYAFLFLSLLCISFNAKSFAETRNNGLTFDNCETLIASFTSNKVSAGIYENVTFNNTSSGYASSKWYINNELVATTTNLTQSFNSIGTFEIRLEVYTTGNLCTSSSTHFFTVLDNIHFCGDLNIPDQDPAECDCLTKYDMDSTGSMTTETTYRWADRWGNKHCNISIANDCKDNIPFKSSIPVPNPPPPSCQAGYFNLYFIDQTIGGTLYSIPQSQRNIVCQVFADMSQLISPAGLGVSVNFEIKATFDPTTSILATAGSYYEVNPLISNAIIHGEVWKAINSGVNDPTLYDGVVNINLAKIFYTGYSNIAGNALPNQYDLYAIMQHEMMHALGFASLLTSYSGASFYAANNLYSSFDEHLRNNGGNVLTNNTPGINYTFNSLGNNCTSVKFNNQASQQSPVNSYQNIGGGGTAFYGPSHFDDACTNNPGQLYVMNSGIAQNQQRRLLQEEVNALCKMGYVLTGNYGTPTLLVNSSTTNPNVTSYSSCSGTGTGIQLAANDDDLTQPYLHYTTGCPTQNPTGSYNINVIGNDLAPSNTTVVDVQLITLGVTATITANVTGFSFAAATPGIYQIMYRLLHSSGVYSNYAIVSILVNSCSPFVCSNNCNVYPGPNVCDLLCNNEFQKTGWQGYGNSLELRWPLGPSGTASPASQYHYEGWQALNGTPDAGWGGSYTGFNLGKNMGALTSQNSPESFGQCVQVSPTKNYILSVYNRRRLGFPANSLDTFWFKVNLVNTTNFPLGYAVNLPNGSGYVISWPPPNSQNVYTSPPILSTNLPWRQFVTTFTPTQFQDFIYFYGENSSTSGNYLLYDNIELLEDNFTAGPDQNLLCQQSVQLSIPCMDLTNLHYEWYQLDASGNIILPALSLDASVTVTPTTTTSYRVQRYISNQGATGNNGYFVEGASSLNAFDDVTIFVGTQSSDFSSNPSLANCLEYQFTSNNQNGTHSWDFGDGSVSSLTNPIHQYSGLGTYTVTHTVSELGCSSTTTDVVNIIINTPSFTTIPSICSNTVSSPLPLTSTNLIPISGTWSPALNNTATTTYTFTPNAGQCATTATMTIVVNPIVLPTFTQVAPICSGATLAALPTTSNNGITGTWSPALNNMATTTYTFTPNAGQCATTTTMTIVVNPIVLPTFTQVAPICSGGNLAALPTSSNNIIPISGTWSPALNNMATTTYTFTPNAGQCATTTTMTITVVPNITPTFTQVGPYCKNDFPTIPSLPTTSLNGISGTWSPPYIVDAPSTTYTFTPNAGQCATTATLTIIITPSVTPTFPTLAPYYCTGNPVPALLTTSLNQISGSWSPPFINNTTANNTIHTFTPATSNLCATATSLFVTVYTAQPAPTFNPIPPICIGTNNPLPSMSTNGITGTWSPAFSSSTVGQTTYTFTPNPLTSAYCTPTVNVTVTVRDCGSCNNLGGTQLSGTISSANLNNGPYRVVGDLTIDGSVNSTVMNAVFAIEPNVQINVTNGANLTINSSHLYGCHALWNGINIDPTGKLTISSSIGSTVTSLIEDAKIAVDIQAFTTTHSTNRIRIANTTFNRNVTGIRINGYPYFNPNTVFSFTGNLFTKRTITNNPISWQNTSTVAGVNSAANPNNFTNPRIIPTTFQAANLKTTMLPNGTFTPVSSTNISVGMEINNVGTFTSGNNNGLTIGYSTDNNPMVFDRMFVGIEAKNAILNVQHAYFQGEELNDNVSIGIRTNSLSPTAAFNGRLFVDGQAKPVQFYNLRRGVDAKNYTQLTVQYTRIRAKRVTLTPTIGEVGIRYESLLTNNMTVRFNTLHSLQTGIHGMIGSPVGTTTPISLNISNNVMHKYMTVASEGLVIQEGIRLEKQASAGNVFSTTLFNVSNNSISFVRKGITLVNLPVPTMAISNNTIEIREITGTNTAASLSNTTAANYYGIQLTSSSSASVGTNTPSLIGNFVNSSTTNSFTTAYQTNLQVRGIMLINTNGFTLSCNQLQKTGVGLYFSGTTQNTIRQNTLTGHRFGLWLESATIGQQGLANKPAENTWITTSGGWSTYGATLAASNGVERIKTYVSGSTNTNNSKMFVRNSLTHNPNITGMASWATSGTTPIPYNSVNSVATATGPTPAACLLNAIVVQTDSAEIAYANAMLKSAMEQSAEEMDSSQMIEAMEILAEMAMYEELDTKPELRDESEVLDEFYDDRSTENVGLLREMDKAVEEKDYMEAESLRDAIFEANLVEVAYKAVLSLTLKQEKGTYTTADNTELLSWANTCSYLYGKATTMARIAWNCYNRESRTFDEDCPSNLQKNMLIDPSTEATKLQLSLFPNPTNGQLYVTSNDQDVYEANCTIRGIDGRIIYTGKINFAEGLSLSNLSISTGVYLMEINAKNATSYHEFMYLK